MNFFKFFFITVLLVSSKATASESRLSIANKLSLNIKIADNDIKLDNVIINLSSNNTLSNYNQNMIYYLYTKFLGFY
jgi:hypothetical protein